MFTVSILQKMNIETVSSIQTQYWCIDVFDNTNDCWSGMNSADKLTL